MALGHIKGCTCAECRNEQRSAATRPAPALAMPSAAAEVVRQLSGRKLAGADKEVVIAFRPGQVVETVAAWAEAPDGMRGAIVIGQAKGRLILEKRDADGCVTAWWSIKYQRRNGAVQSARGALRANRLWHTFAIDDKRPETIEVVGVGTQPERTAIEGRVMLVTMLPVEPAPPELAGGVVVGQVTLQTSKGGEFVALVVERERGPVERAPRPSRLLVKLDVKLDGVERDTFVVWYDKERPGLVVSRATIDREAGRAVLEIDA